MKLEDVKEGGHYRARVSGKLVTVRIDKIRREERYSSQQPQGYATGKLRTVKKTFFDVTNLATGRRIVFRSAAKFQFAASVPYTPPH